MSSKQKNLLKEIKNYNQDSENNKIDLKINKFVKKYFTDIEEESENDD